MNESVDDSSAQINGYNFERKDRIQTSTNTSCKGGGILVYIAEHVNYVRRKDMESIETESVWLEIIVKNSKPFLLKFVLSIGLLRLMQTGLNIFRKKLTMHKL